MFTFRLPGFFILMGFAASLSACAQGRTNLTDNDAVDVRVEDTPKTSIDGVMVLADQQETVVYGRVHRRGVYNNPFTGKEVVAKAVLPDGATLVASDRILTSTPRPRNFRTIYPVASFKIEFPQQLPIGTTVFIKFTDHDSG